MMNLKFFEKKYILTGTHSHYCRMLYDKNLRGRKMITTNNHIIINYHCIIIRLKWCLLQPQAL